MRLPSTFCWPTQAMIWLMLMSLPLEPAMAMDLTLFASEIDSWTESPADVRAALSTRLTMASKDSIMVRPGWHSRAPRWPFWTSSLTLSFASSMIFSMVRIVDWSATASPMPMEKLTLTSHWFVVVWTRFRKCIAATWPISSQMTWISEPPDVPSDFLSMTPVTRRPDWMSTSPSDQLSVLPPFLGNRAPLPAKLSFGRMSEKICLPVHRGRGFRMAGWGTTPSQSSPTHMTMLKSRSWSMNVSFDVMRADASSESWTMPMTGLFDWGLTTLRGTIMSCWSSALAATFWGTCKFISSPSKSALYGDVTDRFSRNVEWSRTLTRWAMMDILWSDGWRLKTMRSSSRRCRSTTKPVCSARSLRCFTNRKSTRRPSAWTT